MSSERLHALADCTLSAGIILYRMMKEFPWKSSKTREDLVEETKKVVDLDYPDTFSEECRFVGMDSMVWHV